jgi:hypothetical protein
MQTRNFLFKQDKEIETVYDIYFNNWHFCIFDVSDGQFTFTDKDQSISFDLIEELTNGAEKIQESHYPNRKWS